MNRIFALIFVFSIGLAACTSNQTPQPPVVLPDELDMAIRRASDYLNENLEAGNKLVILNFESDYPAFSEYIIDELIANTVNDRIFSVVDRANLALIQQEIDFQLSGEVSDESAQAIGKKLGAQIIVSGGVSKIGDVYRLRVRAIAVESAQIQGQYNKNIPESYTITALINSRPGTDPNSSFGTGTAAQTNGTTQSGTHAVTVPQNPSSVTLSNMQGVERFRDIRILADSSGPYNPPIAFSPDGRRLVGSVSGGIKIWNVETGALINTISSGSATLGTTSIVFSPDGRRFATGGRSSSSMIRIWDSETGAYRECSERHSGEIKSVIYSPDGRYIASANATQIKIWDANNGQVLRIIEAHKGILPLRQIVYSPDGRFIASGSEDRTIKIWDTTNGNEVSRIDAGSDVRALAYSPDGLKIASAVHAGSKIIIWSTRGQNLMTFSGHSGTIQGITFSPNGLQLISAGDGVHTGTYDLKIWNMENGWEVSNLSSQAPLRELAISSDGKYLATSSAANGIHIWGVE
jgi:WD40 repeat protein/TolB-like protein